MWVPKLLQQLTQRARVSLGRRWSLRRCRLLAVGHVVGQHDPLALGRPRDTYGRLLGPALPGADAIDIFLLLRATPRMTDVSCEMGRVNSDDGARTMAMRVTLKWCLLGS